MLRAVVLTAAVATILAAGSGRPALGDHIGLGRSSRTVTYDEVAVLLRTPGALSPGPACIVCHEGEDAARGLDLSDCEGILKGSTIAPPRRVVRPGLPQASRIVTIMSAGDMKRRKNLRLLMRWIDQGAKCAPDG